MHIDVRLFTILRHRSDGQVRGSVSLDLQTGATVDAVFEELEIPDDLPIVITVNDEQADRATSLKEGDRIELIPAIAGGSSGV